MIRRLSWRPLVGGGTFWWACALLAPPLAIAAAAAGFGMARGRLLADVATIALWSVAEEIVFRGIVQPGLLRLPAMRREVWTVTRANLATSVLFAACHLWQHRLAAVLGVFLVSLMLGRARDASGRLWPPALLHVYFNLLLYAATAVVSVTR
jgi:membrane protease YdiL (CAAX protease family)